MGIDTLFSAAGFAFGMLLAALLAGAPREVAPGGRWLAAAVLCFALLSLGDWLESSRLILKVPHLGHLFDPLSLLLGPLFLLYVQTLTGRALPSWPRALVHAIPFCLVVTLLLPFYLASGAAKRAMLEVDLSQSATVDPTLAVIALILFSYLVAAITTLGRYRQELADNYSALEHRNYRWIGSLLWVLAGLWAIFALAALGAGEWAQWLNRVALPLAMYALGWVGFRQRLVRFDHQPTEVVPQVLAPAPPLSADADSAAKYQRSGLIVERAAQYRRQLEEVMATDKPYLENDLTLTQLAGRIGLSSHHLSQLFNEHLGQTFFDYINTQRIDDVKRCLADPAYDNQAILSIALEAGFNSKTAFNSAFRKYTGQTPSAFRTSSRTK